MIKPKTITYVTLKEVLELVKDHFGEKTSQLLSDYYYIKVFLGSESGTMVSFDKKNLEKVHKGIWDLIQENLDSEDYIDSLVVLNVKE